MNMRGLFAWFSLLALVSCSQGGNEPNSPATQRNTRPPLEVAVIAVQPGRATIHREYPGRLRAWRSAEVRARVEGIVEQRLFDEGAQVEAGSTLFQIEDSTYRAALEAARSEAEVARLEVERNRSLLEKKLLAPDVLDAARARYQQALAQLARAKQDLDNTRVPAPITGRIGRSRVSEGTLVGHSEPTLLATIEQLDPLYADFTRSEAELLALKNAQFKPSDSGEVRLVLSDGSLYPYPAQILFTERKVDPDSGTVLVRARLPNPDHILLPGTFVRIRMPVAQVSAVMRVPQRAVLAGSDGLQVLVVSPAGKVVAKAISTVGMEGMDFLVSNGLEAGEQVIVEGLQKARPGTIVKTVPWQLPVSAAKPRGER